MVMFVLAFLREWSKLPGFRSINVHNALICDAGQIDAVEIKKVFYAGGF